ncbi:MAG: hypothetical protein U5K51_06985 [Flavobacteriaceae bacterium]|nr:hypothetical protein [Flavobacteriaceae bacterium]
MREAQEEGRSKSSQQGCFFRFDFNLGAEVHPALDAGKPKRSLSVREKVRVGAQRRVVALANYKVHDSEALF